MTTVPTLPQLFPRPNPRILLMLLAFILLISASAITADLLSPRNRAPLPTTTNASQP